MHQTNLATWQHSHAFGLEQRKTGERRTLTVALITAATMVVEVVAGLVFGSMALLADGLHMASHATALGIAVLVYVYARRRAGDSRFAFGTGKVNALGGYTSALLLAGFALYMAVESGMRFLAPVTIAFDQAIVVAVLGLLVNAVSVAILGVPHDGARSRPSSIHRPSSTITTVTTITCAAPTSMSLPMPSLPCSRSWRWSPASTPARSGWIR